MFKPIWLCTYLDGTKIENLLFRTAHVDNEMCLVRSLERLGSAALSKEEPDIGAAFLKFSVVSKELSALMKTLVSSPEGRGGMLGDSQRFINSPLSNPN